MTRIVADCVDGGQPLNGSLTVKVTTKVPYDRKVWLTTWLLFIGEPSPKSQLYTVLAVVPVDVLVNVLLLI